MKKLIKFLAPFLLIISIYGFNVGSASAATSESVFLGSSGTAKSNFIDASSKVFVLVKNTGSVPIGWYVIGPDNNADMSIPTTIGPGGAIGVWVNTNSNKKHSLFLYCTGDTNKCSATGNISLN